MNVFIEINLWGSTLVVLGSPARLCISIGSEISVKSLIGHSSWAGPTWATHSSSLPN